MQQSGGTIQTLKRRSHGMLARDFFQDPERKPLFKILVELIRIFLRYQELPKHYFARYLFKADVGMVDQYLPNKLLYGLKARFNDASMRNVLEDKLAFDRFYKPHGIPLPTVLLHNEGEKFFVHSKTKTINNQADFRQLLQSVFSENINLSSLFVKKTSWSYHGENIFKIERAHLGSPSTMNRFYDNISKSGYLFQETIRQNPDLDRLNPSCLNTLRIDTFMSTDGSPEIISVYLRTSVTNHYVDNDQMGGCEIPVDMATGRLKRFGHLMLKFHGVKRLEMHPQTGVVFQDFQLPHFDQCLQLALKTAALMPQLRLIGWDVALGLHGPILIEGNSDYDIAASDLSFGGYGHNPVFRKVLIEAGVYDGV